MPPNLKSFATKCSWGWRRTLGPRNLCSQNHSRGGERFVRNSPKPSLFPKWFDDVLFNPWVVAGYATYFVWDMLYLNKVERENSRDEEFDSKRRKEMAEKLRGFGLYINE